MITNKQENELIAKVEAESGRKWNQKAVEKLSKPFNDHMIKAYKELNKAQKYAASLFNIQPSDDVYFTLVHIHEKFKQMSEDLMRIHKGMLGDGDKK